MDRIAKIIRTLRDPVERWDFHFFHVPSRMSQVQKLNEDTGLGCPWLLCHSGALLQNGRAWVSDPAAARSENVALP
jgi:hypothetical protein